MLQRNEQLDWNCCAESLKKYYDDPISEAFFNKVMESGLVEPLDKTEDDEALDDWNNWFTDIKKG